MSQLLDYYRGTGTDAEGRRLSDTWPWSDARLESVHNFIQWWFPTPERSQYNAAAPLLSPDDIAAFHEEPELRAQLRRSLERILAFLGLALAPDGTVIEGPKFATRADDVWAGFNHNWLRITRILRCLTLLGLAAEARAFHARLEALADAGYPIDAETQRYWKRAIAP